MQKTTKSWKQPWNFGESRRSGDTSAAPLIKTEEFILVDEDGSKRLSRANSDVALFEIRRGVVREDVEGSDG